MKRNEPLRDLIDQYGGDSTLETRNELLQELLGRSAGKETTLGTNEGANLQGINTPQMFLILTC
ncbi:MAG: hypothetical protein ACPG8A_03335 [Psychrobium sp.]